MLLRLSHFKLNSYVVLVVSKRKGITLVFKTGPLQNIDINSTFDSGGFSGIGLHILRQQSLGSLSYGRARSISGASVSSSAHRSTRIPHTPPQTSSPVSDPSSPNPDQEIFDPTYGLRPEGLPTKSVFSSFSRLFTQNMGLADLAEEPREDESLEGEEEQGSFDVVDWEDSAPKYSAPPTIIEESVTEYEMLPTVGSGTITRRMYTIPNP
ncbi:hypothetical protein F4604DRAFT_1924355 [Suillus subluteus]|nr:hypothetical protein F4604DRAFT_1924355 [Suillus subluteus]